MEEKLAMFKKLLEELKNEEDEDYKLGLMDGLLDDIEDQIKDEIYDRMVKELDNFDAMFEDAFTRFILTYY